MIESMTGYGRGETTKKGITSIVELRSVNNRFLEVTSRLPRVLSVRENEIKEIIRSKIGRGKISLSVLLEEDTDGEIPIILDVGAAKSYYKLLNQLRKTLRIKESVKLEHLLHFSEIFTTNTLEEKGALEWAVFEEALQKALSQLKKMRLEEGKELINDLKTRVLNLDKVLDEIEKLSKQKIPEEQSRLEERIKNLVSDATIVNSQRLEMEIAFLVDRLDVTEECVRFRSHNKFFLESFQSPEPAGRKLNFLIQEMNREANTIGSKSNDVTIAHHVVMMKEELEKIREQIQNVE